MRLEEIREELEDLRIKKRHVRLGMAVLAVLMGLLQAFEGDYAQTVFCLSMAGFLWGIDEPKVP